MQTETKKNGPFLDGRRKFSFRKIRPRLLHVLEVDIDTE